MPGPTRSGKTSTSTPWPLVAGSYHEPVSPCWLRSGAAAAAGTDAEAPAKLVATFWIVVPFAVIAFTPSVGSDEYVT